MLHKDVITGEVIQVSGNDAIGYDVYTTNNGHFVTSDRENFSVGDIVTIKPRPSGIGVDVYKKPEKSGPQWN